MALEMLNLVEMGGILHGVIEVGGDLVKMQSRLGLDSAKLGSSLSRIRSSMTHMEDIANVLSATIEIGISNPKQLSADQEVLRKELLTEMEIQKNQVEKLREHPSKELQLVS